MAIKISAVIFLLSLTYSNGYFDDQPKLITENGNLIIESGKNRNITFRLQGTGSLTMNGDNLLNSIVTTNFGFVNTTNFNGNGMAGKIIQLEERVDELRSKLSGGRGIPNRLSRLENRTATTLFLSIRVRRVVQRVTRLERSVLDIISKLEEDNCKSNPCLNGGVCYTKYNGFNCKCTDSWTGPSCSDDVNECAFYAGSDLGCQNGAVCLNTPGSYNCACPTGWQGIHCTRRNIDCLSSSMEICGHGTCVTTNDAIGFKCICEQGWTSNGITTALSRACIIDKDECNDPNPHCSVDPLVKCINLPGSFMCGECPAGYTGNGHYCVDINECETNNGGCSTVPTVSCINTRGSHYCGACPTGFEGDGKTCIRSNSIGQCNNYPCNSLARCIESQYGPVCICPSGYVGIGIGPNGCTPGTLDPCSTNPCLNGGTCRSVNSTSFSCACPTGTLPPICHFNDQDPCHSNPCKNGGTCSKQSSNRFVCRCTDQFTGRTCQSEMGSCGGVLLSDSGYLKYPISDKYPHNSKCAWLIRTNVTQVLNITFTKFELEYSAECRFDWLQIHDGRSSASYMIGRFCGHQLPKGGNIISTNNYLYLWFRSDNSTAHDGFELTWDSIPPVCGGEMQITAHGTISSPGSPGNYPPNRLCDWHLIAPPGKRIQLHFFTMQLEAHDSCAYDYLTIFGGGSTSSPMLENFCNTTHPEPLTSPSNEITMQFRSDQDGTDAGFQIHYSVVEGIPGCGGTYTMNKGEIASPLLNGVYPKNMQCEFLIRLPKGSKIKITFKLFELEKHGNCKFDYVEIYEGTTTQDAKVGTFCGEVIPDDYISIGNNLLIVFKSDWSYSYKGFRLSYELSCGGHFDAESGVLLSPLYPQTYEENRDCRYFIEGSVGKGIVLDFLDMDIEGHSIPDCNYDSVSLYDGHTVNDTLLGKYCGESIPPQIVSTYNELLLLFQSDSSLSGRGFKANYSMIDIACGGVIKKMGHLIKPPMLGSVYKAEMECKWIIVAPPGHIVQTVFTTFDLEEISGCTFDYVAIYDSTENPGHLIGKYCGHTLPPVIVSNSNMLTIVFVSDQSVLGDGFLLTYSFLDSKNICGGNYYTTYGMIRSPGYPKSNYQSDRDCTWIIIAPNSKQIELNINFFELEDSSPCSLDYLEIRNGGNVQSPLIGKYCGTEIPKTIRSFTNQIYIHFKTDFTVVEPGFEIEWDATSSGCGGILNNSPRGSITSPNYPQPYGEMAQCDWRISVSAGSTIQLTLADLDMEEHGMCLFDSLQIFDGRDTSAHSLGKYCSSSSLFHLNTSTNHVFLRMQSDISHQGRGFNLNYNINCKREIHDHRGVIESPGYPNDYPNNLNCEWTVMAPKGNKIKVHFSAFNLEGGMSESESAVCHFDYFQIEERIDAEIIRSDKYCHTNIPAAFTSNGEIVIFKFVTDISNTDSGFHLEFEVEGCGDHFIRPEGNFVSPNYPNNYPHSIHCEWAITTDFGTQIELTFSDFDFEAEQYCYSDGLIVANSKNFNHPISQFCGSIHKTPAMITSRSNELYVKFYADDHYSGRGFSASYKAVQRSCGGVYKLPKGNIASLNYPNNYNQDSYCEWFLETDETHTLSFNFFDFDFEESSSCEHDFILIYDGFEKTDEKLIIRHCGSQVPNTTIMSTKNKLLVIMQTDSSIEAKGFNGSFSTNCGSNIVTNSNGIIAVGSTVKWITNTCTWVIKAENPTEHIVLTFVKLQNFYKYFEFLNVELSNCFKTINIYDGDNIGAPLKEQICGELHPPAVVSNGNALTISITPSVKEYNMAFGFEFEAQYSVLDNTCGGNFKSKGGIIASPLYPKSYPLNIECIWTIEASPGNRMLFSIEMLDIDQSDNCNQDYLEIRENNESGKLLGLFCGDEIPESLPSVQKLWLKFRSDNDIVGKGFKAEYNYARNVELSGETGILTSPMYPDTSYLLQEQTYRIYVKVGYLVSIIFDSLSIKFYDTTTLSIYDGYDTTAPVLVQLEQMTTEAFISSTNVVYIVMSFIGGTETKFQLTWTQIAKMTETKTDNATETLNCTRNSIVYVQENGIEISSPGFPLGYDVNLNCSWTFISGKMGYHPTLLLLQVDLNDYTNCEMEYLKVSSSKDLKEFRQLGKFCQFSKLLSKQFSGNPYLKLQFFTDPYRSSENYRNKTGFSGFIDLSCGGLMTGPNGIIAKNVSRLSLLKQADVTCEWEVSVKLGRTIQFEFLQLNLRTNDDKTCINYVLIQNGIDQYAPYLGKGQFCGNETGTINVTTTSNRAFIKYYQGGRGYMGAFMLAYRELSSECGGSFLLTKDINTTIITSPNYPNIPTAHTECVWTVTAPNGEFISIDFKDRFDMTTSINCDSEYVELYEGGGINGHFIGRYCTHAPDTIKVRSNIVRIKFFTEVALPKNGFKLIASISKCGGFYRSSTEGYIKSEGYPGLGAYPSNSTCDYRIQGKFSLTTNITIIDLDLPPAELDCNESDTLTIYNVLPGTDDSDDILNEVATYCQADHPPYVIADGPEVLLRFTTFKPNTKYRGFYVSFKSTTEQCGNDIIADTGVIVSPGYPTGRKVRKFCEWRITVPKGKRIKLDILDLDLAESSIYTPSRISRLFQQRIGVYNDHTYISRIKFLTTTDSRAPLYSSDNKMLISAWLLTNVGHRGFKFRFTSDEPTTCIGNLDGDEGSFQSLQTNLNSFYCEYLRTNYDPFISGQPQFGSMSIRLTELSHKNQSTCFPGSPSGVYIYFEANRAPKAFYRNCNRTSNLIGTITTPFPSSKIVIRQSYFTTLVDQFKIEYKVHRCGGIIDGNTTFEIVQPDLIESYGEVNCAWQFNSAGGLKVNINVSHTTFDCANEYINIYNGRFPISPKSNRICGDAVNNSMITLNGHNVFIEYHSNIYNTSSKFQIVFQSSYSVCGGIIQAPIFKFRSPLNGTQYPNRAECIWDIRTERGFHIGVEFVERFFIEQSVNCTKDYVEIFDMIDEEWKSLGRICGRNIPKPFNSTGLQMRIIFRSDNNISGDGFIIRWQQNCGGIYHVTTDSQILTSPNYPDIYPRNIFCNYTLIAPNNDQLIRVNFNDFELEDTTTSCRFDNVTVYRYSEYQMGFIEIGSYCATGSLTTINYKRKISIVLRSDNWLEKRGFKFQYSLDHCGGLITNNTVIGYTIGPLNDHSYSISNLKCQWNITAPANKTIVIRFEVLAIPNYGVCYSDHIQIFTGHSTDSSNLKAKLCSNVTSNLPSISVDSNKAIVLFELSFYNMKCAFSAAILFVQPCNYQVALTETNLAYTINQSFSAYASNLECHYKITAPKGYYIMVKFDSFHLAPCSSSTTNTSVNTTVSSSTLCSCDFVEIRDGPASFSDLIAGPLCGHIIPNSVISLANAMWLRFSTDSIDSSSGFNAVAMAKPTLCGKEHYIMSFEQPEIVIENPSQTFAAQTIRCRWYFEINETDENIRITFENMNIQCDNGELELLDENVERVILEGTGVETDFYNKQYNIQNPLFYTGKHQAVAPHKYCGTDLPEDFYTSSNRLQLKYNQIWTEKPASFKIKASIHKACERNYTSLQGRIFSRKTDNCQIHITTLQNTTISLYFAKFSVISLASDNNKQNVALEIHDGRPNGKLLQTFYHDAKPEPLFTNTNKLILNFFKLNLNWVDYLGLYDITYLATDKGIGCGGQIFNYAGTFASPMYPQNDRNYSDCRWDIRVPNNLVVAVQFEIFDLGSKNTCADNYLQLIEVQTTQAAEETIMSERIVRQFCGEDNPSPYKARLSTLSVRFKKTTNFAGTGWIINFMAIDENANMPNW